MEAVGITMNTGVLKRYNDVIIKRIEEVEKLAYSVRICICVCTCTYVCTDVYINVYWPHPL